MTPHNTPLTSLYPQRYLADFSAGLGILIIGGNIFSLTLLSQKRPRRARPFPCSKRFWETDDATANIQTTNSVEYQGDPSATSAESPTIPHSHPRGEGGTRCSEGYLSRGLLVPGATTGLDEAMSRNSILPALLLLCSPLALAQFTGPNPIPKPPSPPPRPVLIPNPDANSGLALRRPLPRQRHEG